MPFRLLFEKETRPEYSLDSLPFEEWCDFVFNHSAPARKEEERWYWKEGAEKYYFRDSHLLLKRLSTLFRKPEALPSLYNADQIKQGFWCFISAFELPDLLDDPALGFEARAECVRAVEQLYLKLFSSPSFEKLAFLYWDPLSYPYHAKHFRAHDTDAQALREVMFQTLCSILTHKARHNFLGALHGLGHLGHPETARAVKDAVASRSDLQEGDAAYAQACVKGVMDTQAPPKLACKS